MPGHTEHDNLAARLIGVGVGPGDPELLTVRAMRVLQEADVVVAPTTAPDAIGRAETIVRQALPELGLERVVFDMGSSRLASHEAAAERIRPMLSGQKTVAFVTLGDPNVYSTFSSLVAVLRARLPGLCVETVPGIMAFQELAARSGVVVLDGSERLHLVTALDGTDDLESVLRDVDASVVVYKGGRHLAEVQRLLEREGRSKDAVFGELLGLPGERIASTAAAATQPATYLATVLVPPVRDASPTAERVAK
jgi:precorrin-2/cobalt-factor-2 C20-methyltransferase